MQWNSPKNAAKTGGPAGGWSPQPMAATTGAGYRPMVSPHVSFPNLAVVKHLQHASTDCRYTNMYTYVHTHLTIAMHLVQQEKQLHLVMFDSTDDPCTVTLRSRIFRRPVDHWLFVLMRHLPLVSSHILRNLSPSCRADRSDQFVFSVTTCVTTTELPTLII